MSKESKSIGAASVQSGDAAGFRLEFISLLAAGIGLLAGLIAYVLYNLIGLITNIAFYHQFSTHFRSPEANHLGGWVILLPVAGGLIVDSWRNSARRKLKATEFRKRWKRCSHRAAELKRKLPS